jgi:hypothetical protein
VDLDLILDAAMILLREILKEDLLPLMSQARHKTQYMLICVLESWASEVALVNSCIN